MAEEINPVPAVKPGWKTTEFWSHALVTVTGLLITAGVLTPGSKYDKILGLVAALLSSGGYNLVRGWVKSNQ